jgi:hypothetical protein
MSHNITAAAQITDSGNRKRRIELSLIVIVEFPFTISQPAGEQSRLRGFDPNPESAGTESKGWAGDGCAMLEMGTALHRAHTAQRKCRHRSTGTHPPLGEQ